MAGFYARTPCEEVWLVLAGARFAVPEGALPVARAEAAFRVRSWLPRGLGGRPAKVAIVEALSGAIARGADDRLLEARIEQALAHGLLQAFRREHRIEGTGETEARGVVRGEPGPSHRPAAEERTWIGIELVEEDPPQRPIPFARYRIELPDGSVREGILDQAGRAEIRDIDPGTCKITFPDRHRTDWRAA